MMMVALAVADARPVPGSLRARPEEARSAAARACTVGSPRGPGGTVPTPRARSRGVNPKELRPMSCVDLHLHLLPGVDDGPRRLADSLRARRLVSDLPRRLLHEGIPDGPGHHAGSAQAVAG